MRIYRYGGNSYASSAQRDKGRHSDHRISEASTIPCQTPPAEHPEQVRPGRQSYCPLVKKKPPQTSSQAGEDRRALPTRRQEGKRQAKRCMRA
jgi:hypothetical protein